jgi:hypothetical protein
MLSESRARYEAKCKIIHVYLKHTGCIPDKQDGFGNLIVTYCVSDGSDESFYLHLPMQPYNKFCVL